MEKWNFDQKRHHARVNIAQNPLQSSRDREKKV